MQERTRSKRTSDTAGTLFVGSVEKGFRVLDAFRRAQNELGLSELGLTEVARLSGLDKSAAQRFTNTLAQLGYLDKDPRTRRYRPAIKLAEFYHTYVVGNHLAELAMPRLIEASKVYDTTVNLCEPSGTGIIYIIRIPHQKAYYNATIAGRWMPAFCTASGVVILANRPREETDAILAASDLTPLTEWTETNPKRIRARIDRARKRGYDIGIQQSLRHEISTAAPVLDREGKAIGAVQIPVYMPSWREAEVRKKIVPLAMETARAISGSLSGEA
ncbi:MAG: IclR family transcriptional regulator [Hyphomicrobiales bacterium]|nr:IclR family transcriptional regulator [Hyphomicrobiales bacterium]